MRLLLIEDDPSVAGSIELMLTTEDFQVETARLGEDGVSLGRVNDYGLIVLDLNLPDMSGYEVLRSLRTGRIRTPVLILSGLAERPAQSEGPGVRSRRLPHEAVPQGRASCSHKGGPSSIR